MPTNSISARLPNWRTLGALFFFFGALAGFQMGVSVTERPDLANSDLLTKAYYSLSLFVVGGVDLGTPTGGPLLGRCLLWLAYFGAPILAASTVVGALVRGLAPAHWQLRRLKGHVIVAGADELTLGYLRVLRAHHPKIPIVVVNKDFEPSIKEELKQAFNATVLVADIAHEYFLKQLRLKHAAKILLLCEDSLRSYEAGSLILSMRPGIGDRVVIHAGDLRFMRAMKSSSVAKQCQTFNTYQLAAEGLVSNHLLSHFQQTEPRDSVVLAGFGRFGQTILEELQDRAANELQNVVIIDKDARRRVLIAEEQREYSGTYRRELFDGDISNPEVWIKIQSQVVLDQDSTVVVLGTGREEENLRTALWIKEKFPNTKVIARSSKGSRFASEVGNEHDIVTVSISKLVEENIPRDWVEFDQPRPVTA